MSTLQFIYLLGWWLTLGDVSFHLARGKPTIWCVGAAIGCVAWPITLAVSVVNAVAEWMARQGE